MAMDFGLSFSPTNQDKSQLQNGNGPSQTPIQDAIRTLSLRIPQFRGPGIAPMPLLNSPGSRAALPMGQPMPGQGQGMPANLQQILQQLFGGGPSAPAQSAPLPNVRPGSTPPADWNRPPAPYVGGTPPDRGFDTPPDPGHFFPGNWPT